jgi:hypothetical protein
MSFSSLISFLFGVVTSRLFVLLVCSSVIALIYIRRALSSQKPIAYGDTRTIVFLIFWLLWQFLCCRSTNLVPLNLGLVLLVPLLFRRRFKILSSCYEVCGSFCSRSVPFEKVSGVNFKVDDADNEDVLGAIVLSLVDDSKIVLAGFDVTPTVLSKMLYIGKVSSDNELNPVRLSNRMFWRASVSAGVLIIFNIMDSRAVG